MASRLDQALDEVIRDRQGNSNDSKRSSNFGRNARRDHGSGGGAIRKRVGSGSSSPAIRSFVRTVNVMEERVSQVPGLVCNVLTCTRCC